MLTMRWMTWLWLWFVTGGLCSMLGVDFGSEFTKAVLVAPNIPFEVVLTGDSKRKDASGVLLKPSGQQIERIYGSSGLSMISRFPQAALYYLKPLLGISADSPAANSFAKTHVGHDMSATSRGSVQFSVSDLQVPVEEAVAMIFRNVKTRASELLAHKFGSGSVSAVSVAVPGQYTLAQRKAIIDAVELAGLQLVGLVNDGVAVAVNYASARQFSQEKQFLAVYDMGAQSTSSTLVSIRDEGLGPIIEVEGFGYDDNLGGQAMTQAVREMVLEQIAAKTKVSVAKLSSPRLLNRIWRSSENIKQVLSINNECSERLESIHNDIDVTVKLSRDDFEQRTAQLAGRVTRPLETSLNRFAGEPLQAEDLDSVILAGGGTRTRFVQARIKNLVGNIVSKNVNADEAASLGTTLRGVNLSGIYKARNITVIERTPFDYSLDINGQKHSALPRGSELTARTLQVPVEPELLVTLEEDGEPALRWHLAAGEVAAQLEGCSDEPVVELRVGSSASRLIRLEEAAVRCTKSVNGTERRATRFLTVRPQAIGVQPLGSTHRQAISQHLRKLDEQDAARVRRDVLHHELETLVYRLREIEDPVAEELGEWIDSGAGSTEEYEAKLEVARLHYQKAKSPSDDELRALLLDEAGIAHLRDSTEWLAAALADASQQQLEALVTVCRTQPGPIADVLRSQAELLIGHTEL